MDAKRISLHSTTDIADRPGSIMGHILSVFIRDIRGKILGSRVCFRRELR
jgi:hypothetical protein